MAFPLSRWALNSAAVFSGNISCSPMQRLSILTFQSESRSSFSSPPALKSTNRRYSGSEPAIRRPSLLRMLPRTGFTSTLSFVNRSATSIQ